MRLRRAAGMAVLTAATLAACDDAPDDPPAAAGDADVGPDGAADAGPASEDGALDGPPDARRDATADAAPPDARPDASCDACPPDAAPDAAALDGTLDGGLDLGGVDAIVDAAPDAVPDAIPDLMPDMPWEPAVHRVFMTADSFTADFGGVEGADAACAAAAAAAGLPGTWRAIISDAATGARDRLTIEGPIETTAGERVAQGADDLWDGRIRVPIAVDARGQRPGGRPDVWTGTDSDGSPDARANSFCSDWGRADRPLGAVEIGRGDLADGRWIAFYRDGASAYNCGSEARLYCIDGQ